MSDQKPPRVFLSYSRPDRARVAKLAAALTAAGIGVWWDTAIDGGASFSADIERELEAADVVVVAWSTASVKSTWVLDEAGAGRDRGRLVPVQLDATPPPLGFRQFQAIDLSAWKGRAGDAKFAALLSAIQKLAGATPVPPAPVLAAKPGGPSRRALIGGGAGVAALTAGGFGAWKFLGQKADDGPASIAVLPFANLSGDPAQAYFSDGIAEELRSALATIAGLKVAARTSSELMRDTDIKEAAPKLGVTNVVTGSVRRGDGKVRVTAQLLNGQTGLESWSQVYDRPAGDVLEVQTGIAQSVANALSLQFGKAAALVGGTKNPIAYDAYLRATANQLEGDAEYRAALADIDAAIAADPDFALAHAFRSVLLVNMGTNAYQPQTRFALLRETLIAANRAIALMPTLRAPYSVIGRTRQLLLDFKGAEAAVAKAATLPKGTGRGIILEALFQSEMGRSKTALALIDSALAIDPFSRVSMRNRLRILMDDRKADIALAAYDSWNNANPSNQIGSGYRYRALMLLGRPREALVIARTFEPESRRLFAAGAAEAVLGDRKASDASLTALLALPGQISPTRLAMLRTTRGEIELAFGLLDRAMAERDTRLASLRVEEAFDPLRADPRYAALEKRLGLPPR